jgi:hypothetical protein
MFCSLSGSRRFTPVTGMRAKPASEAKADLRAMQFWSVYEQIFSVRESPLPALGANLLR